MTTAQQTKTGRLRKDDRIPPAAIREKTGTKSRSFFVPENVEISREI
jgi:hypothetical protein